MKFFSILNFCHSPYKVTGILLPAGRKNFPSLGIQLLREKGYKVVSIRESSPGISDEEVIRNAVNNKLIILTFDSDYGKLLFKYEISPPPAIIYFRFKGAHPSYAANILIEKIENENLKVESFFTVIEENNIRQRKLL